MPLQLSMQLGIRLIRYIFVFYSSCLKYVHATQPDSPEGQKAIETNFSSATTMVGIPAGLSNAKVILDIPFNPLHVNSAWVSGLFLITVDFSSEVPVSHLDNFREVKP